MKVLNSDNMEKIAIAIQEKCENTIKKSLGRKIYKFATLNQKFVEIKFHDGSNVITVPNIKLKIVIEIGATKYSINFLFDEIQDKQYLDDLNKQLSCFGKFFLNEEDNHLRFVYTSEYPNKFIVSSIFDHYKTCLTSLFNPHLMLYTLLQKTLGSNFPPEY